MIETSYTGSPYHRMNLIRNPFGVLSLEERAEVAVVQVTKWLALLHSDRSALQFLGPCGHGKTTHMLAIGRYLTNAPYVYLPEDLPTPKIPSTRPLLLDELQRLNRWQRWRLFRQGGPLIIGTHEDYSTELRRAGFDVHSYEVASECSPDRLRQILNQRIEAARFQDGSLPRIEAATADKLYQQFGANIRAIEHHLYHQFQQLIQEPDPWPLVS